MDFHRMLRLYLSSELQLTGAYKIDVTPGKVRTGTHTMEGVCGIVIPIHGQAIYRVGGKEYVLERGKILFAGENLSLDKKVLGDQPWSYYLIHYHPRSQETQRSMHHPLYKEHFVVNLCERNMLRILHEVQVLTQSNMDQTLLSRLKSKHALLGIIVSVLEYGLCYHWDSDQEKLKQVQKYIQSHYTETIVVENLSAMVGMEPKPFYYLFKKHLGISPKQYLTQYRMERSKEMLAENNTTVSDVARMVGYEDVFHFSRIFKKYVGMAPKHFREQLGKTS